MPSRTPTAAAFALALAFGAGPAVAVARQELTLGTAMTPRGQNATISLGYAGDGSAAGLQLDVTYDATALGTPTVTAGTGLGGQLLRSATVASGRLRLVVYSPVNGAVGDGELARLAFPVKSTAPLGSTPLTLTGVVLGNANAVAIPPTALTNGSVGVLPSLGSLYTVVPCRLVDTRNPTGPLGGPALQPSSRRTFTLAGVCNLPTTARALLLNVTAVSPTAAGDLRFFAADLPVPLTSVLNFSAGQTRTNNAIIGISATGDLTVQNDAKGTVHLVIDVNGYFQ